MDTNNNTLSDLTLLSAIGNSSRDNALTSCHDTGAILQGQAASNVSNMAANERMNIAVEDTVDKHSLALREAIERNGMAGVVATDRTATAQALAIERNGSDSVNTTEQTSSRLMSALIREGGEIKTGQERIAGETRSILATNNTAAALLGKDIQIELCELTGKLGVQASENFGKLESDIQNVKCALELQGVQNTAAIQLEALKNKAMLATQLAECCCELKETVGATAAQTQSVIREIDNNRVRDALAAATTENLIASLRPAV
jgi:hypothetical protein